MRIVAYAVHYRTHTCGDLNKDAIGQQVTLAGWVNRRRDHGGLVFLDIRDRYGMTQVICDPERSAAAHRIASELRSEYVVQVKGTVVARLPGTENQHLSTGAIEVAAEDIEILNPSRTTPFPIRDDIQVDESLRLKYRYLDLRRPSMRDNMILRHRVVKAIRDYLDERGFLEIETPILMKSTPEGARDYLVPSRLYPGEFYALPQSPQQLKQLLMIAGLDRYFQIALAAKGIVKGIRVPGAAGYSRKDIEELTDFARMLGARGLVSLAISDTGEVKSPLIRFMSHDEIRAIIDRLEAEQGDLLLF